MLSILLVCSASFPFPLQEARSGPRDAPGRLGPLAVEYEHAFEDWAGEISRAGAYLPESQRPPGPAALFWPRFEALAERGKGRAPQAES